MKKLAPLFAAIALASSGGVLAADPQAQDDSKAPPDSQAAEASGKPTQGFVLIQRNIYVPVDDEGKIASNEWVVIDRQGFVTADELNAAQEESDAGDETAKGQGNEGKQAPRREEAMPSPSSRSTPSAKGAAPLGRGPMIKS